MNTQQKNWAALAVVGLLSSGSGVGSSLYYLNTIAAEDLQGIARPDPATGTELRALRREVEYHLHNHPDIVNRFDRRLTRLEAQLEIMQQRRVSP